MNDNGSHERISPMMGKAMVGVAGTVDVVKFVLEAGIFIPIVGEGTEILGDMVGWTTDIGMCVWFLALGVSPFDGGLKSPGFSLMSAAVGDVMPVINMAPFDCVAVLIVVRGVQKRDKAANDNAQAQAA